MKQARYKEPLPLAVIEAARAQPKSNRAKYCAACAKRMRRRKEAERQRKRYWQHEA